MNTASHPFHGILLILAAGLVLASHDGIAKYLALSHPLILVIWARYLSQSVVMLLLFGPRQGLAIVRTRHPVLQLIRGLCLVAVSLLFVSSLRHIPLGEATSVLFLAPLFVTGLSATLLCERVSAGQWGAVILGMLGVLVIVRPGGALFTPAVLLPLGAALCLAVFMLLSRRLSESDGPVTCNFLSSLVGSLPMSLLVPFYWETPDLHDGLLLSVVGGVAMSGHLLLSHAYRYASAATLAPFTYSQLVFAVLVGFVAFGHVPDSGALLGIAIVIASGVLSVWVQRRTV
ncbi:DMT family transporter [Azotobacter armeniacus]